jgi:hypothetical protein
MSKNPPKAIPYIRIYGIVSNICEDEYKEKERERMKRKVNVNGGNGQT